MNKKYHILLLPSWYPDKAEDIQGSFFREQALALKKYGYKVGVIAPMIRSLRDVAGILLKPYGLKSVSDCGIMTLRWYTVNCTPRIQSITKYRFERIADKLYKKYVESVGHPDIIHVHSLLYAGYMVLYLANKYKLPYIITEHSSVFARNLLPQKTIKQFTNVVNRSSKNIAVSNSFKNILNDLFNVSSFIYIPNIVQDSFLEEEVKVKSGNFTFITVCMLNSIKRVDLIIKSFALAFKGSDRISLKIGGDGPLRDDLERLASNEGVASQTTFLGRLDRNQVKHEILNSDCFILASDYETFSVVVVEALALGKPVVATRCGGPESTVTPLVGLLVKKNSVDDMAQAMKVIYDDKNSYSSCKIRDYCIENFSEKAIVGKLKRVYCEILDKTKEL